jgi:hypothetical protein
MEAFGFRTAGLSAKFIWAVVHIQFLAVASSRIGTMFRWYWAMLTRQRLGRLIIEADPVADGKSSNESSWHAPLDAGSPR